MEANPDNEASRGAQAQNSLSIQSGDANSSSDVNPAQKEELAKLRQEVIKQFIGMVWCCCC